MAINSGMSWSEIIRSARLNWKYDQGRMTQWDKVFAQAEKVEPSRPQVLATPDGWVRLDEAGNQIAGTGMQQSLGSGMQLAQGTGLQTVAVVDLREVITEGWLNPLAEVLSDLSLEPEPADDIMSAVRAVARGS